MPFWLNKMTVYMYCYKKESNSLIDCEEALLG